MAFLRFSQLLYFQITNFVQQVQALQTKQRNPEEEIL